MIEAVGTIKRQVCLSQHAVERIESREREKGVIPLTMTCLEVIDFLSNGLFVEAKQRPIVGKRYSPKTTYWLFYSPSDSGYFIAIGAYSFSAQKHIIYTIIPSNKKKKWNITHEMARQARAMACNAIGFFHLPSFTGDNTPSLTFKVSCFYESNGRPKIKKLLSVPMALYDEDSERLAADMEFRKNCIIKAEGLGIKPEDLLSILIRKTKSSAEEPHILDVSNFRIN